jgi:hypothetical protein
MTAPSIIDQPADRPLPWEAAHLLRACAAVGVSVVALMIAWWGASGTTRLSTEFAWMNLGVAGLVVIGATLAMWLLVGRRAVGRRDAAVTSLLEAAVAKRNSASGEGVSLGGEAPDTDALVWGKGMTLYHRATCQLVAGKPVRSATTRGHERARRKPCQICLGSKGSKR